MVQADTLGGTLYIGDAFGPYEPVLGGAVGEEPIYWAFMSKDESHLLVNYQVGNNTFDVVLVELVDDVVVDSEVLAEDGTLGSWSAFDDHAVIKYNGVDQFWQVDYADLAATSRSRPSCPAPRGPSRSRRSTWAPTSPGATCSRRPTDRRSDAGSRGSQQGSQWLEHHRARDQRSGPAGVQNTA